MVGVTKDLSYGRVGDGELSSSPIPHFFQIVLTFLWEDMVSGYAETSY